MATTNKSTARATTAQAAPTTQAAPNDLAAMIAAAVAQAMSAQAAPIVEVKGKPSGKAAPIVEVKGKVEPKWLNLELNEKINATLEDGRKVIIARGRRGTYVTLA